MHDAFQISSVSQNAHIKQRFISINLYIGEGKKKGNYIRKSGKIIISTSSPQRELIYSIITDQHQVTIAG